MRRNYRDLSLITVLLALFCVGNLNAAETFYPFRLGSHQIKGNVVEFLFPMPPPSDALYLSCTRWKGNEEFTKGRLVVKIYNSDKKLIGAGQSVWKNIQKSYKQFGSVTFGTIHVVGVGRKDIRRASYFSIAIEKAPGKDELTLDERRAEVRFAKKVLKAIKQGKDEYLNLFAGNPLSESEREKAGENYDLMVQLLEGNLSLVSVLSMNPSDEVQLKYDCIHPYEMTFGPEFVSSQESNGAVASTSVSVSLPIGQVNNQWRILLP